MIQRIDQDGDPDKVLQDITAGENQRVITTEWTEQPRSKAWGNLTDPQNHNPDGFRYLVHAFNLLNEIVSIQTMLEGRSAEQGVDLVQQPERLNERVSLSMSLIDQNHTVTWGPGGILVQAPETNVIISSAKDTAVTNSSLSALEARSQDLQKLPADDVLQQTKPGKYNEVVALGTDANGNKLKLNGFFVIRDVDGDVADPALRDNLRGLAEKTNLPFVEISDSRYQQEGFSSTNRETNAQFGGKLYHLRAGFASENFTVDTGAKNYFATRDEIAGVVNHFVETGKISREEGNAMLAQYNEAYKTKMKPVIATEGDKNYISFKTGVGTNFTEYHFRAGKIFKVVREGASFTNTDILIDEFTAALDRNKDVMFDQEYQAIRARITRSVNTKAA